MAETGIPGARAARQWVNMLIGPLPGTFASSWGARSRNIVSPMTGEFVDRPPSSEDPAFAAVIRVVVTDQDAQVCRQLATIIDGHPELQVIATASSEARLLTLVAEHRPDVVVVDPRLQHEGLDLCQQVRAISPETRCLLHTAGTGARRSASERNNGTMVVFKQLNIDQLIACIRQLASPRAAAGHSPTDNT